MKNKIVFNYQLNGHNLEYIHHLYEGASIHKDCNYIFVLPEDFENVKDHFEWSKFENISFHLYRLKDVRSKYPLITAYRSSLFLRKIAKQYNADEILLVWMIAVLPFIGLFIPKHIKVSGIIYNIYLYFWKTAGLSYKVANALKYMSMVFAPCVANIYILNDQPAVRLLNKIWRTNKFLYLADPVVPFTSDEVRDLRAELNIPLNKKICLHAGAMSFKKGTLSILDMIENSSEIALQPYTFVFAGTIYPDIKEEFYARVGMLQSKVQIVVKDGFLPYEYLGSMYKTCDYVLLPYSRVDASSGSIAYASQFGKQVIASNKGLLAKLIRRYGIGSTTPNFHDVSIIENNISKPNSYWESHTVEIFNKQLLG